MRASLGAIALISTILILPISVLSQACEATSQNPYCDPSFANLICCPAPNVCYWADRQGTPACCASGQVCGVGGGVYITPQPTIVYATDSTQPTSTTTLAGGVVETVTSGAVAIYSTVTSDINGVYQTVTSAIGGAYETVSGVLVGSGGPKTDIGVSVLILPLVLTFWTLAGATGFYYR